MNNNCQRKYIDNNDFISNFQHNYSLRQANINQQEAQDKQIQQKKDTFTNFTQSGYNFDKVDINGNINNRAISPNQSKVNQVPCNFYQPISPYKNLTGQQKTSNGKQHSFYQHQSSFVGLDQNENLMINNNNNISETTLNTTNASFSQFLNQTVNTNKISAIDMSNTSHQNPSSSRQYRQANSFHCLSQIGYQQNSFQTSSKAETGDLSTYKGTPVSQKNVYSNQIPIYDSSERSYHSVYQSPIHSNVLNSYIHDSGVVDTSLKQYPSSHSRTKSTHINYDLNGNNMSNYFQNNPQKLTNNEINHQNSVDGNGSKQSARGHYKNNSCFTPSRLLPDQQNNNSSYHFNQNYDNHQTSTTKQISQIENIFSNIQNYSQTPQYYENNQSASQKLQFKQNLDGMQVLNYSSNKSGIHPLNNTFNSQIQQYNQINTDTNKFNLNNTSINTPRNNKEQKTYNQVYDCSINNQKQQPQQTGFNSIEQSIPLPGHTKSHSLHQQKTGQSFNTSFGSINQSNFLQNSSFINHNQKQQLQLDSKSTFNPSSNFGSIAQNKSGFLNSQSSFLNSNGEFLVSPNQRNTYQKGVNSGQTNNFNSTFNGLLGQQSLLNKGPQLQKIIDDLKENIVKDLESLTSKLYKDTEQILNNSGNSIESHSFESVNSNPIQLAEYNIGDDKKVRFSFSGKEVITQITSTNMKLNRDQNKIKDNVIQTYATPLNSSQFLSPYQQQLLTEQIINCSIGKQQIQQKLKSNIHEQKQGSQYSLNSPQSIDLTSSIHSHDQSNRISNLIPISSHTSGIKPSPLFNNPTKLFEMQQDNQNNKSFNVNTYCEKKEENPKLRNEQNINIYKNQLELAGISYLQKSDEELKILGQFLKNNDSSEQKQSHKQSSEVNKDQSTFISLLQLENKENNPSLNQNQMIMQENSHPLSLQKPILNNHFSSEFAYEKKNLCLQKYKSSPENQEEYKRDLIYNQYEKQTNNNTPEKKEIKNINTEESENTHGKLTPCFQSSKNKNVNKNTITTNIKSEKTSEEKLGGRKQIIGLTPFCLNFDNKNEQANESRNNLECEIKHDLSKSSISSFEIANQNDLVQSDSAHENIDYEEEFQNINQVFQGQSKNDNLSDQDDVILRTDNTDQFGEDSPQIYPSYPSSQQQIIVQNNQQKFQINQEDYKEPDQISQYFFLEDSLSQMNQNEIQNLNTTIQTQYNFQKQQKQTDYQSNEHEKQIDKNKQQPNDHITSTNLTQLNQNEMSETKKTQILCENKISSLLNNSQNSGYSYKKSDHSLQNENNSSKNLSLCEQSLTHDRCSYRGSAKSNQSNSSAQNRYQNSEDSPQKQSQIENSTNNEPNSIKSLNIYNNDTFTFQNIQSLRYQQNTDTSTTNKDLTKNKQENEQIDENLNNVSNSSKGKLFDQQNTINNLLNVNNIINANKNLNENSIQTQSNQSNEKQIENSQLNKNNSSNGQNLQNGNNIRFSTYLKQHEDQKNKQTENQGLTFYNQNYNSNNESLNSSFISSSSSQPHIQRYSISPANVTAQKQILFKNKSNLKLFKEYEMKMKTQQKQGQANQNECYNSLTDMKERFFNINNNTTNENMNGNSKPNSQIKININDLKMNTLQLNKLKENNESKKVDEDEVHSSRENPLDQIRENTNSTQENEEDQQSLTFQNQHQTILNNFKRTEIQDDRKISKQNILTDFKVKKDSTRSFLQDSESNLYSGSSIDLLGGFYNSTKEKKDSSFFQTPSNNRDISTKNDSNKLNSNSFKATGNEQSPTSSFKDSSQPTQSPYYASSRSNFYESTQKLIEDSVTLSNMKNDNSYGNMSKYSNSSSQSKHNNNASGISNQDDSKRSETSRILRHNMDDDDNDGLLNIDDNFDNIILNDTLKNYNNQKLDLTAPDNFIQHNLQSTPEKIQKKVSEVLKQNTPLLNKDKDSTNSNNKIDSQVLFAETQIPSDESKKAFHKVISSPKLYETQKQRQKLMEDIFNNQNSIQDDLCSSSQRSSHSSFSYQQQQNTYQQQQNTSFQSLSESQQLSLADLRNSIESIKLEETDFSKVYQQKLTQNTLKDFEFSSNSLPQSLIDIPESSTAPSFSKIQNHESLCQIISSSIQVEDEDGTEITISIVSHKRSSVNQSKTILKKSLIQSPTSKALNKASSVQKSQRRISFKDKIEEVYNFQPEDRNKSRSPILKDLPRTKPRFDLRKEPYFNSIKKFPGIQNNPTLLQQYKNKSSSNTSYNLEDKIIKDQNNSSSISEASKIQDDTSNLSILSRRDSKLINTDDMSSTKPLFKSPSFTPNSSNNKKVGKISFLEYQKINKN